MALNLVSPGVKVREVDLTVGRIDGLADQVGAIAGPFAKGPLAQPPPQLLNWFGLLTGPGSRRRALLAEGVH